MSMILSLALAAAVTVVGVANADESLPAPRPVEPVAPAVNPARPSVTILHAGDRVTLRVRDVAPHDGLSPGERLLGGLPALQPHDRFLAETLGKDGGALVAGRIVQVEKPGWFGKPGRATLEMVQLVRTVDGREETIPWNVLAEDRRFTTACRRRLLTTLFALEGAGMGAAVGAQLAQGNIAFIGGGAGIGLVTGLGYASLQRGPDACFEPGTTFHVVVGTASYVPANSPPLVPLYPAADPARSGGKR